MYVCIGRTENWRYISLNLIYPMNMIQFGIHIGQDACNKRGNNRIHVTFAIIQVGSSMKIIHNLDIAIASNLGDPMANSTVSREFYRVFSISFKFKQLIRFKAERCEITSINSFEDVITSTQTWSNEIGHDNLSAQHEGKAKKEKTNVCLAPTTTNKKMAFTNSLWHLAAVYLHCLKCRRCVTSFLSHYHIWWRHIATKGTCTPPYIPSNWMNRFQLESNICTLSSLRSLDGKPFLPCDT